MTDNSDNLTYDTTSSIADSNATPNNTLANAQNGVINDGQAEVDNVEITRDVEAFYKRADAIIELANSQLGSDAHSGQVGASLLYASARYSASVASIGFVKGEDLVKEKNDIIDFYTKQYHQMLSDNLDDYAKNFDKYVQVTQDNIPNS